MCLVYTKSLKNLNVDRKEGKQISWCYRFSSSWDWIRIRIWHFTTYEPMYIYSTTVIKSDERSREKNWRFSMKWDLMHSSKPYKHIYNYAHNVRTHRNLNMMIGILKHTWNTMRSDIFFTSIIFYYFWVFFASHHLRPHSRLCIFLGTKYFQIFGLTKHTYDLFAITFVVACFMIMLQRVASGPVAHEI